MSITPLNNTSTLLLSPSQQALLQRILEFLGVLGVGIALALVLMFWRGWEAPEAVEEGRAVRMFSLEEELDRLIRGLGGRGMCREALVKAYLKFREALMERYGLEFRRDLTERELLEMLLERARLRGEGLVGLLREVYGTYETARFGASGVECSELKEYFDRLLRAYRWATGPAG